MLEYLFTAYYKDGTEYKQTEEDRSIKDPKRSCYFDVEQDKLIGFSLKNKTNDVFVDLRDGSFNINGLPFSTYTDPIKNIRLIYYRRVFQEIGTMGTSTFMQYYLGWQGNDPVTGENIQRTVTFS